MKKTILLLLICINSLGISYGQVRVHGIVYSDSTLPKRSCKAKIILKFAGKTEVYKTDKYGKFDIVTKMEKFALEIKKKDYVSVTLKEISKDMHFDVLLRKVLSIHDKDYKGVSKIILKNEK